MLDIVVVVIISSSFRAFRHWGPKVRGPSSPQRYSYTSVYYAKVWEGKAGEGKFRGFPLKYHNMV